MVSREAILASGEAVPVLKVDIDAFRLPAIELIEEVDWMISSGDSEEEDERGSPLQ